MRRRFGRASNWQAGPNRQRRLWVLAGAIALIGGAAAIWRAHEGSASAVISASDQSLPFPASGGRVAANTGPAIMPLRVEGPGAGHALMLLRDERTEAIVAAVFVSGQDTVTVRVPRGRFRASVAYGREWYGDRRLFGPATDYHLISEPMVFDSPSVVMTVSLRLRRDGNLPSAPVSQSGF